MVHMLNGALPKKMPDAKQIAAMEAKACQFADALLAEGHKLDAPDKWLMVRLLTLRAASKAIARVSKVERVIPSVEIEVQGRHFMSAVGIAIKEELAAAQRLAAQMAAESKLSS